MFNDTPVTRADISELPVASLRAFIDKLRERRMRAYTVYMAAQEAKREKHINSQQELLDKRIAQFEKKLQTVDKGLQDLERYALDILTARQSVGHIIEG